MDMLKNAMGGGNKAEGEKPTTDAGKDATTSGGGGGLMDKFNNAAGGGAAGEKNEDFIDKGVDLVQEYGLKQGQQSNESAVDQGLDKQYGNYVRGTLGMEKK